jgi:putative tricarboxylic transport membrane protein
MLRPMHAFCRSALVVTALLLAALPAYAGNDGAAFFQGKQLRFYTMGGPGGGYDSYMRMLGNHLRTKLGVTIIPTNETGAGGLIAMNRTLTAAPDGLTILLTGGEALVTGQLYSPESVNYDVLKQVWLARVSSEVKVGLFAQNSAYRSFVDVIQSDKPVVWGGTGKTDGNTDFSAIVGYALGMKTKLIIGYKGTGEINLAIQKGEIDARVVSEESAALVSSDSAFRVLATLGRKRTEQFPDAPTVFEAAKLTPAQARLIDWRAGIAGLGRVVLVTPGTPPDRVEALRAAFAEIVRDPSFAADMKKMNLVPNYADSTEVTKLVERSMTALDGDELATVRDVALKRYYQ